jgi:putative peptidoglycan lipid II flippase
VFVNTYLATSQEEGSVSWLNYAFRLMYLPIGLFGVSIATAALPDISRNANSGDLAAMRRTVSGALRMMMMLNVPATVGLIALAHPIVALLYERGKFTPADTASTALALMFYAPGLLGYSAVKIASPSFYALRDSRTPATVSMLSVLANLCMNLALVRVLGYRGLALGTAVAAMLNAVVLLWLLERRLDGLERARILVAFAKILAASVAMGLAAHAVSNLLDSMLPGTGVSWKAIHVFSSIGAGVVVLLGASRALRIAEFDQALERVLQRFKPAR